MACLTDIELQTLADNEGSDTSRAHVMSCERCRARLDAQRGDMARLTASAAGEVSAAVEARVRMAIEGRLKAAPTGASATASAPVRGATSLRPQAARTLRPLWATALAVAAAFVIVTVVVLPKFGAPTSLSASQIIDRSLERMTGGQGIEILEYELVLASTLPQHQGLARGPFHIYQAFDRANPRRYKFAQYDADGVLQWAATQDPAQSRRSELMRVDGQNYIVHISSGEPLMSLPEILQAQAESVLKVMQLSADEKLTIVDGPEGRSYVIEISGLPSASGAVPLDLRHARVVIDGGDFRVREFTASGVLFKQPFDVSFTLRRQVKAAAVAPADWEIPAGPDDVVIEGEGSGRLDDVTNIVLRELGKTRGR